MMAVLTLCLLLGFLAPAHAQTDDFFFHHSATPVTVPGGTTNFFLDMTTPLDVTPLVENRTLGDNQAMALPTFISMPFGSGATLLPIASVRLNLSANQKMRHCAQLTTQLFKVDGTGALTAIGAGFVLDADVSQAKSGGTVGFTPERVEFQVTDTAVPTGNGIQLNTAVENHCHIARHIFLAYDSLRAPSRLRFQCCFTTQAKCAAAKIKAARKKAACLLALASKEAEKGQAADPAKIQKCKDALTTAFTKLEAKGNCLTTGDAASIEAGIDGYTADVDAALNPGAPTSSNKCQALKIKAASTKTTCLLGLKAKAAATGNVLEPLDPNNFAKCVEKFSTAFSKLETKGGCVTSGDAGAIESKIDAFVDGIAEALACPCPP
jgi:hypothetical protein